MPISALPAPPTRSDATNFNARADAFLSALPTFATEANSLASEVNGYASNAAASAATATNAPGTSATSTTSLAIGTGTKALTVQTGKAFVVGQWVTVTSTATPANWMHGQITAYTSGTGALTVNVTAVGGSGTYAAWTIGLSAPSQSSAALLSTSSYADPAWLTSLAASKLTGTIAIAAGGTGAGTGADARTNLDVPSRSGIGASGTWGISISGNAASSNTATTATVAGTANALNTSGNYQLGSLGVGTAASGVAGEIRSTGDVTAFFASDARLKENIRPIEGALGIVLAIGGKAFDWNETHLQARGGEDGLFVRKADFGVIAQDVEQVFPLAVRTRPDGFLAVDYAKLAALAFQAITELKHEVDGLRAAGQALVSGGGANV
ncbi:MAG: tail fiber domain-containing protein [Sphingomonadaceae bacterium]|nr:tail fiber domain-containing protein [Sphingomonadaceae bacterium]